MYGGNQPQNETERDGSLDQVGWDCSLQQRWGHPFLRSYLEVPKSQNSAFGGSAGIYRPAGFLGAELGSLPLGRGHSLAASLFMEGRLDREVPEA